jgi:predicted DNA-binding transcriptional regulator AlpA
MPQVPNPPDDPQQARLPLQLMVLASLGVQSMMSTDPGESAMLRPAVVTHRVPSQTKEFSSHFVTCSSFRVALQPATARFCTLLQRAAMNTPRSRRSLPTPTSPLLIDAATAAHLCGRSLRTWWSWHAAGRCPEPVRIGRSQLWRPDEIVAWVAAGCPPRKEWVFTAGILRELP